jgi:prevent-host-death family protein
LVNLVKLESLEVPGGTAMTETVNLYEAKTNLSKLVERAAAGEEIVIAKAGKPKARLVPYEPPRKQRVFGQNLLGITYIADDFDAPLPPEIQRYFDGEGDDEDLV